MGATSCYKVDYRDHTWQTMKELAVPRTCNHELHLMPKVLQILWDERLH